MRTVSSDILSLWELFLVTYSLNWHLSSEKLSLWELTSLFLLTYTTCENLHLSSDILSMWEPVIIYLPLAITFQEFSGRPCRLPNIFVVFFFYSEEPHSCCVESLFKFLMYFPAFTSIWKYTKQRLSQFLFHLCQKEKARSQHWTLNDVKARILHTIDGQFFHVFWYVMMLFNQNKIWRNRTGKYNVKDGRRKWKVEERCKREKKRQEKGRKQIKERIEKTRREMLRKKKTIGGIETKRKDEGKR